MKTKKCLDCGTDFFGRSDKKFCSDSCRNAYNNLVNSNNELIVKRVNRSLRKNRRILNTLNPEDKIKVSMSQLIKKGFDFDLITSIYTTKEGKSYRFCYEQGYLILSENNVLLVKREISD